MAGKTTITKVSSTLKRIVTGNFLKTLPINRRYLLDIALLVTAIFMVFTGAIVILFHLIFLLLTFGAFYWKLQAFALRAGFWVMVVTATVLAAVLAGETQVEELIEIPMLSIILGLAFVMARQRARGQKALRKANKELEKRVMERTAELTRLNAELSYEITRYKQVEGSLRKLSSVVEQTADIVFITDKDGVIEYVNPTFERQTGYTQQEAIGQTPRILKSDQHNPRFYEELWETILSGQVYRGVVINKKKNGELYYGQETVTPIRDTQGNVTHFVSTGKDITGRMQAEEALRDSEERYRCLVELSFEGIAIHIGGKFVYLNDSAVKLYGATSKEELVGKPILDFVHPDYLEIVKARLRQTREKGEGVPLLEEKFIRLDGTSVDVEATAVPITYQSQPAVQTVIRDITARKRAEAERERLLTTEREQRLLAETLGEVFLVLTAQTRHETVLAEILRQAQRLISYSAANIVLLKNNALYLVRHQGYHTSGNNEAIPNLDQSLADFPLDAQVVQSRQPLIIPDTRQNPDWVTVPKLAWIRSFIAVPICLGDHVLGLLRLDSDIPGKFSAQDVERLQPVANAAAIALKNARLYDQARREIAEQVAEAEAEIIQLNRKLLTLQYAGTTITSDLDLQYVLDTVTKELANLLKVEGCAIFEWDQAANTVSVMARYDLNSYWQKGAPVERYPVAEYPLMDRLLVERRPQQMTGSHPGIYPAELADMQAAKLKTMLMVPMEFQDRVVGLVKIMDGRVERTFTNREIALVQLLANQAASAIENTRLYDQVRQEIAERKQAEKELRQVAAKNQAILDAIPDSMFYFSRAGELLDYKVAAGGDSRPAILGEITTGKNLSDTLRVPPDLVDLILQYIGKTIDTGTMQVFEYQLPLSQDTRDVEVRLVASGLHEVLAIVSDITERKQAETEREKERARIARDLHDSLGQSLGYLRLKLDEFIINDVLPDTGGVRQELAQMRDVANEAYELVRSMLAAARPANSAALATVLLAQARSVGNRARFKVRVGSVGQPCPLSPIVQQQVLYIFQEALSNVEKHANAQQVDINLVWTEDILIVTLSDNGHGFETGTPRPNGHFGLTIMQERAEEINGFLSITSRPNAGTELTLQLPLTPVPRSMPGG